MDADVVGGEAVALLGCAVGHGGGGLEVEGRAKRKMWMRLYRHVEISAPICVSPFGSNFFLFKHLRALAQFKSKQLGHDIPSVDRWFQEIKRMRICLRRLECE